MEHTDVLIIGAGLLGCFAARELSAYQLSVTVLEAREDVCMGVSRANTGIVYPGYDTKPGTLKTTLCVQSNANFDRLCRELDVPFHRCGSLMIACGERADNVILKKYEDGCINEVPGLRLLSSKEILELEPNLTESVSSGLYCPGTGVVNPWSLGIAAYENAMTNGVRFLLRQKVCCIVRKDNGFLVETEQQSIFAKVVLNCAGLQADSVRELCEKPLVRIFPSAADYLILDRSAGDFVRHVVFHEPERKGKGLTLVPTVDGNLLVGPTEHDMDGECGATDADGLEQLRSLCSEIVPSLQLGQTIRAFGAARPNPYYVQHTGEGWQKESKPINSFTCLEENGLFSLIGIKTPGLTCAAELGKYVTSHLLDFLGGAAARTDYHPERKRIPSPSEMSEEERIRFVSENPAYGKIICRCNEVSEGEILEAIRRGASTIDGIKFRTGAGMGRCQGSFCMQSVLESISAQYGLPPQSVCKAEAGTEVLYGTL